MSMEEKKNKCTLKLPINNDEDEILDFLDIDEEELVHDVKQAVSPTSSRSLENPDFNSINLLFSTINATNNITNAMGTSSNQFIPYFGHPVLFSNNNNLNNNNICNNQNLLNLVALCINTPPPFNGLPQNNPFFSSNGINEHVNIVPFSATPFFYFGLPEDSFINNNNMNNNNNINNQTKYMCRNNNIIINMNDIEMDNNIIDNEYSVNNLKIKTSNRNQSNLLFRDNSYIINNNMKSTKLRQGHLNLFNNDDKNINDNFLLEKDYNTRLNIKKNLYLELNQKHLQHNNINKRLNNLNNNSNIGTNNVSEKKNRWQLSDPQFKSGYKGVSWNSRMEAWLAFFVENGVRKSKTFSSRKFGFNRAKEKAIKYLDARRKGIILTTPPPLSPSKGIYDRIPQQRKMDSNENNIESLNNFQSNNDNNLNDLINNNVNNKELNTDIICS